MDAQHHRQNKKRAGTRTGTVRTQKSPSVPLVGVGRMASTPFMFGLKYNDSSGSDVETDASTLCKYIGGYHPGIPTEGCSIATKLPCTGGTM